MRPTRALIVPAGLVLLIALGGIALSTWQDFNGTHSLTAAGDGAHHAAGHLGGALNTRD